MTTPEGLRAQIEAAMPLAIEAREGTFLDAGSATRPAGADATPDLDENGMPLPGPGDTQVYAGPCTVSDPTTAQRSGRNVNDESGVPNERVLKLPVGSSALLPGDLWTVTASRFSPGLVGDRFTVVGEVERSYATSRRYLVRGSSWQSPPSSP